MNATDLSKGTWLVVVEDGGSSATTRIEPDFIELYAASVESKDAMMEMMMEKSKLRPRSVKLSKKEQKTWKAYDEIMGKDCPKYFEYASFDEIADAGISVLIEKAKRNKKLIKKRRKPNSEVDTISNLEL